MIGPRSDGGRGAKGVVGGRVNGRLLGLSFVRLRWLPLSRGVEDGEGQKREDFLVPAAECRCVPPLALPPRLGVHRRPANPCVSKLREDWGGRREKARARILRRVMDAPSKSKIYIYKRYRRYRRHTLTLFRIFRKDPEGCM